MPYRRGISLDDHATSGAFNFFISDYHTNSAFNFNKTGNNSGNLFRIQGDGRIGINSRYLSDENDRLLTVNGDLRLGSDDKFQALEIRANGGIPYRRGISLDNDANGNFNFYIHQFNTNAAFNFCITDEDAQGIESVSNLLQIHKNGNVGIGLRNYDKLSNVEFKLQVDGAIRASKIKVYEFDQWPDYVFDENYNLRSLNEVSEFILTNHHLPGFQNSKEIADEGIDIGKNQILLVEKIEELTLYLIELSKENQKLKAQMSELQVIIRKEK